MRTIESSIRRNMVTADPAAPYVAARNDATDWWIPRADLSAACAAIAPIHGSIVASAPTQSSLILGERGFVVVSGDRSSMLFYGDAAPHGVLTKTTSAASIQIRSRVGETVFVLLPSAVASGLLTLLVDAKNIIRRNGRHG